LRRFGTWWLKEFLDLFPERIVELLAGGGKNRLVILVDQDRAVLELHRGYHARVASPGIVGANVLPAIDEFLRSQGVERRDVDVGIQLPKESVFCRQLLLPSEAIDAIAAIVADDLARKTPFKSSDIYTDYATLPDDGGKKQIVWQWITRRRHVEDALSRLDMDVETLSFVTFERNEPDQPVPFINLRSGDRRRHAWYEKASVALACSVIVLALLATGIKYWSQQVAMDDLAARIATVATKARQVRASVDRLHEEKNALMRLRLRRQEEPGLIDLWNEATRVLPSRSWLTELRLTEGGEKHEEKISMSGFSSAAPSLVGIVDGSPLFYGAGLTSPIAFDAREGRERFALDAKVRMPDIIKEAAR